MNLIDECIIYNKSFKDDLRNYVVKDTGIEYDNGVSKRYTINLNKFRPLLDAADKNYGSGWFPVYVSDDTAIDNKILSSKGSLLNSNSGLLSGRIGIENFITFVPEFQNWTVTPECKMTSDWVLNRSPVPHYLNSGILCWAQQLAPTTYSGNISSFPLSSRVREMNDDTTKIHYRDRKLFDTTKDGSLFNSQSSISVTGDITFSEITGISMVSGTGWADFDSAVRPAISIIDEFRRTNVPTTGSIDLFTASTADNLRPNAPKYILWIPNGDYFSYYTDKTEALSGNITKSYISPSLWSTYNQIYHMLSIKQIKTTNGKNIRKSRLLKKIASVLSTSPYITDECINALGSPKVQTLIKKCLDATAIDNSGNTVAVDISDNTIKDIVKLLHNKFGLLQKIYGYNNHNTLKNNIITNNRSLFIKLIDKYGCKLKIDQNNEILLNYQKTLDHGDSINIIQSLYTLCPKETQDTDVINNQTIKLNQVKAKTDLTSLSTSIKLTATDSSLRNKTTSIPLYDIAEVNPGKITLNVLMHSTTDGQGNDTSDNPNNHIFKLTKGDSGNEIEIPFRCLQKVENPDALKSIVLFQKTVSCLWQKIKGACLKFSDENKSSSAVGSSQSDTDRTRFDTSTFIEPIVFVYKTGEYQIQCSFITPYGTFIKRKTFFVVDGRETIFDSIANKQVANPGYNKYYDDATNTWQDPPPVSPLEIEPIIVNSDKLKNKIASFKNVILHKHGIFWPIQTDHNIERVFNGSTVKEGLKEKYKFIFEPYSPANFLPVDSGSSLIIQYNSQDTILKLDSIILQNIRDNTKECKTCLSVCQPKFDAIPSVSYSVTSDGSQSIQTPIEAYVRTNKAPDSFVLKEYRKISGDLPATSSGVIKFSFPEISLDFAPPLKAYGGYGGELFSGIGLSMSGHPVRGAVLPSVTGYPLNYPSDRDRANTNKACYQIPISATGYIPFRKGLFHPASGFIMDTGTIIPSGFKNKTSVLKFNPGARDTYSFIGPGIFNFNNGLSGSGTGLSVSPITYQSSISLSISKNILPETACAEPGRSEQETDTLNKLHKEFMDQQIYGSTVQLTGTKAKYKGSFHGYRILEGGQEKKSELSVYSQATPVNDEFGFSIDKSSCSIISPDKDKSTFNYRFATNGPNYKIDNSGLDLKIKDLTIQDIEIKLNFLNYVNPKNLVVWLDFSPCSDDMQGMSNPIDLDNPDRDPGPACPLKTPKEFMDQTFPASTYSDYCSPPSVSGTGLQKYITNLHSFNSVDPRYEPLKLLLFNQEYIQNNKYNMSLTFSDHASKYSVLFDENKINASGLDTRQEIVRDNHIIPPSISATGFDDTEAVMYKNIIRTNKLNISNNSFSKFRGFSLFKKALPRLDPTVKNQTPSYDSGVTFTLNLMVLDEPEEMMVYDNVINNEFITNFTSLSNTKTSSNIYNSLCSWELILHTGKKNQFKAPMTNDLFSFGTSDILGLLDYTNKPRIPGYNFISYFPSGEIESNPYISYFDTYPSGTSLIPRVNQNAPYVYINDSTLCQSAESIISGASARLQPTRFPVESVLMILAGILGGTMTANLVGLMVALTAGFNAGYQGLFDFFAALRDVQEREGRLREVYAPDYDHFSFGSPEKVLLNVSKDGGMWYKLEASIFKYKNTPALYGNSYKFIRLKRGNIPFFSEFNFNTVYGINQLVDDSMLSTPYPITPTPSKTSSNTPEPSGPPPSPTPSSSPLSHAQIVERLLSYQTKISQLNATLGHKTCLFTDDLATKISNKKIIIIKGSLAYNLFHIDDTIPYYNTTQRDSTTEPSTTKIINKALIFKNNQQYSVFELKDDISLYEVIACNGDTLLVFKNHISNLSEDPFGVWGLEKSPIVSEPPEIKHSAMGLGSYGDGSPFAQKSFLSYKLQYNKLYTIHEIFNNRENDKIKQMLVNLKLSDNTVRTVGNDNGIYGYGYTNREIKEIFEDKYNNIINKGSDLDTQDSINYLLYQLTNSTSNINVNGYTFMFLKSEAFTDEVFQKSVTEPGSNGQGQTTTIDHKFGDIIVPEDLVRRPLIKKISESKSTLIKDRIDKIESKEYVQSIEENLGNSDQTQTDAIIDHASLYYLEKHLHALPYDPIDCYKKKTVTASGTYTPTEPESNCPKKKTNKALNDLYTERSTLLQVLEINNLSMSGIVPLQQFSVSGEPNGGPIFIKLSGINDNLFWINIDPKQSCSIAEEMCPKVLKSLIYNCLPLTETTLFNNPNNNICPGFLLRNLEGGGVVNLDYDRDNVFNNRFTSYHYTIPSGTIQAQKQALEEQYPSINAWAEFTRYRTFNINSDQNFDKVWNGPRDLLVKVQEIYDIGLPEHMTSIQGFTPSVNDGSADYVEATGLELCPPLGPGAIRGSGLLTAQGKRVPLTRVYNIFNLDDTTSLKVQFRKIPRQLRGVDLSNTVYRYGRAGVFRQTNPANPPGPTETDIVSGEGSLNNQFYVWQCIEKNAATKKADISTLPNFFKLQNEMAYRAFYGSVDGIENKSRMLESLYSWELIPYEYFTKESFQKPPPTPTPSPRP